MLKKINNVGITIFLYINKIDFHGLKAKKLLSICNTIFKLTFQNSNINIYNFFSLMIGINVAQR